MEEEQAEAPVEEPAATEEAQPEPVADAAEEEGAGAVTEPAPEPEPTAVDQRISELSDRLREERRRNDELMRHVLDGQSAAPEPTPEPLPDPDPDVAALVAPVVAPEIQKLRDEFAKEREGMQDVIAAHQQNQMLENLQSVIPDEAKVNARDLWPEIQEEFRGLPEDMQRQYDNWGGVEALANRVLVKMGKVKRAEENRQAKNLETLSQRTHVEGESKAPLKQAEITPGDIMKMTDEEVEAYIESQQGGRPEGPPGIHPLIQ